jgi:fatty acid-binding protein DegV
MFTQEVMKFQNGKKVPVDNAKAYKKALEDLYSLLKNDYISAFDADIGVVLLALMLNELDDEQEFRLLNEAARMFKKRYPKAAASVKKPKGNLTEECNKAEEYSKASFTDLNGVDWTSNTSEAKATA